MSYAELSSAIPRAGGAYNFARVGFGRGTSFVSGWMEWFASSVAGALYAVCFATYFVRFLNGMANIVVKAVGVEPQDERAMAHSPSDLLLLIADQPEPALRALGRLRLELGHRLGLISGIFLLTCYLMLPIAGFIAPMFLRRIIRKPQAITD